MLGVWMVLQKNPLEQFTYFSLKDKKSTSSPFILASSDFSACVVKERYCRAQAEQTHRETVGTEKVLMDLSRHMKWHQHESISTGMNLFLHLHQCVRNLDKMHGGALCNVLNAYCISCLCHLSNNTNHKKLIL